MLIPARFCERHRQHVRDFAAEPTASRPMAGRRTIFGLRKSGEEFPAEAGISKLRVRDKELFSIVLRDISERKRREDQQQFLSEVAAVLASTIDYEETLAAVTGLLVRDLADCCIVDLVGGEVAMRRLKVAHREPTMARIADTLQQFSLGPARPYLASSVLDTREPLLLEEVTPEYLASIAQSDEHLSVLRELDPRSLLAVPLVAHGQVLGSLVLVRTSRMQAQRPFDLALVREVGARAALAVHNARLYRAEQQATAARDRILGVVAHDLRNPLNAIVIQAALLRRAAAGIEVGRAAADAIHGAAMRMNRLIQDLLDVRQVEGGHFALRPSLTSVEELVRDAADAQRPSVSSAGLELRVDVGLDLPPIFVDRDRLLQVFENLSSNALKFTPPPGRLTLGAARKGDEVVFRVHNTGPAIARDDVPHVFEQFWQRTAGEHRGVGLGLWIVKTIVEAHGGRVWVESAPQAGTTFYFALPIRTTSARSSALAAGAATP